MDSCNNNLMDKRTSRMAGRTATIDNNSNDSKSIATCNISSSARAYNTSVASIMRSSNNSKSTAAYGRKEATKTCNNNPMTGSRHIGSRVTGSTRSSPSHDQTMCIVRVYLKTLAGARAHSPCASYDTLFMASMSNDLL